MIYQYSFVQGNMSLRNPLNISIPLEPLIIVSYCANWKRNKNREVKVRVRTKSDFLKRFMFGSVLEVCVCVNKCMHKVELVIGSIKT